MSPGEKLDKASPTMVMTRTPWSGKRSRRVRSRVQAVLFAYQIGAAVTLPLINPAGVYCDPLHSSGDGGTGVSARDFRMRPRPYSP